MAQGAAEGIWTGIGEGLGGMADRITSNRQKESALRDSQADKLSEQIRSIADNIAKVGGKDKPEAAPLVQQLEATVKQHNDLYPDHETPALIQRLQKLTLHKPGQPRPDPRAGMSAEAEMAASPKIADQTTTDAWKLHQNDLQGQMAKTNADVQQQITQKTNDATLKWAKEHGIGEDQILDLLAIHAGIPAALLKPPAEHSGQFTTIHGKLADGTPFSYQRSGFDGHVVDMAGNKFDSSVLAGFQVDPATAVKNKQAWILKDGKPLSVMLDANNHPIPGTENPDAVPPAEMFGRITTGQFHWVDQDGNVHEEQETHTSTPMRPGGTSSAPSVPSPGSTPGAVAAPRPAATGVAIPKTPAEAHAVVPPPAGRILGNKGTPALTAAKKEYDTAVKMSSIADDALRVPSATKDKMLAIQLVHNAAGRFNMAEFDTITKKAGLGNSFEGWMNSLTTGELPVAIRKQLVDIAKTNLNAAHAGLQAAQEPVGGAGAAPAGGSHSDPLALGF